MSREHPESSRTTAREHSAPPVFLTGYPKSGTTLLLSLLDGHPALNVFPKETLFFQQAYPELKRDRDWGLDRFVARIFEGVLFGLEEVLADPVDASAYREALDVNWEETGFALDRFLDVAVETYGELIGTADREHWVEKTPHTELFGPLIANWYPDARIIHCLRDPRANYAAIRVWNEREGRPASVPRFASHWTRSWRAAKHNRSLLPQLEIRYEDLVRKTETAIRDICNFLEIDFDPVLLSPTLGGKAFHGNSMYKQTYSGVSDASLDRWKSTLNTDLVAKVERLLGSEMAEMGYEATAAGEFQHGPFGDLSARIAYTSYRLYDGMPGFVHTSFRSVRKAITGIESTDLDPDA